MNKKEKTHFKELAWVRFLLDFSKETTDCHVSAYTSYAVLFIIMAMVPFCVILLACIRMTPLNASLLLDLIQDFLPSSLWSYAEDIIDELYHFNGITVLSLSALTMLWTASKGAMAIDQGINNIYHVQKLRNYALRRLFAGIYTVFFIFFVLIMLLFIMAKGIVQSKIVGEFPQILKMLKQIALFKPFVTTLVLFLFFLLLYTALPNRRMKAHRQIPGAALAALLWTLFTNLFALYINNYANVSLLYGSLAAIIIFIIWLYFCMYFFFLGGILNHMLQDKKEFPSD